MLTQSEVEWILLQRRMMMADRRMADEQGGIRRREMAKLQARREQNGWDDTTFDHVVSQTRAYREALGDEQFYAASAASRASVIRCLLAVDEFDSEAPALVREAQEAIEAREARLRGATDA